MPPYFALTTLSPLLHKGVSDRSSQHFTPAAGGGLLRPQKPAKAPAKSSGTHYNKGLDTVARRCIPTTTFVTFQNTPPSTSTSNNLRGPFVRLESILVSCTASSPQPHLQTPLLMYCLPGGVVRGAAQYRGAPLHTARHRQYTQLHTNTKSAPWAKCPASTRFYTTSTQPSPTPQLQLSYKRCLPAAEATKQLLCQPAHGNRPGGSGSGSFSSTAAARLAHNIVSAHSHSSHGELMQQEADVACLGSRLSAHILANRATHAREKVPR